MVASTLAPETREHVFMGDPWVFRVAAETRSITIDAGAPGFEAERVEIDQLRFDSSGGRQATGIVDYVVHVRLKRDAGRADGSIEIELVTTGLERCPEGARVSATVDEAGVENDKLLVLDLAECTIRVDTGDVDRLRAVRVTSRQTVPEYLSGQALERALAARRIDLERGVTLELRLVDGAPPPTAFSGAVVFEATETHDVGDVLNRHVRPFEFDEGGTAAIEGLPVGAGIGLQSLGGSHRFDPDSLVLSSPEGTAVTRTVALVAEHPPVEVWGWMAAARTLAGNEAFVTARPPGADRRRRSVRAEIGSDDVWRLDWPRANGALLRVRGANGLVSDEILVASGTEARRGPIEFSGVALITVVGNLEWVGVPEATTLRLTAQDPDGRLVPIALPDDGRVEWSGTVGFHLVPGTDVFAVVSGDGGSVRRVASVPADGVVPPFDFRSCRPRSIRLSVDGDPATGDGQLVLVPLDGDPSAVHELELRGGIVVGALVESGEYLFFARHDDVGGLTAGVMSLEDGDSEAVAAHRSAPALAIDGVRGLAGVNIAIESVAGRPVPPEWRPFTVPATDERPYAWPECTFSREP